jgi:uncharacterized protein (UPF0332 family)
LPEEEEIEILIGRAKRRLDAACLLFEDGFYEDAVSRAYYSMYFAAKALLLKKDITVKTHKGLLSKFGLEFVNEGVVEEWLKNTTEERCESQKNSGRRLIIQFPVRLQRKKLNQ